MARPVNVLMVEDSEDDARLLKIELQRQGFEPDITRVDTGPALRSALATREWDIVISDHNMPGFSGDEALSLVKSFDPALPFIVVMGASNGMSTLSRATSLAQIFGARHYGAISGAVALGANGARAIGPVGASLLLLGLGAYPSVFWALAASLVCASLAVLIAGAGVKGE